MLSVLIHTLGCKLNQLESESFKSAFKQAGFVLHNGISEKPPSVVIVNTCTVTSKADQKARRVIRKVLRDYPDSMVVVTGCYAQLEKEKISRLEGDLKQKTPQRLFVMKREEALDLPNRYSAFDPQNAACDLDIKNDNVFQFFPKQFSSHTRSFLKIQDGCNNHCTYCRIRLARGKSISLNSDIVLERLRILEKNHAEAVLTGVNICQYNDSEVKNLGGLLEHLLSGTQKIALRLSSLEPCFIEENLLKILSHKRIRAHFHLSIQSCSEKILKKMGRGYNGETIEKAALLLRGVKNDPFLACDIITGFPGETDSDFNETYEMCKKIGFAWIHVFPYSKRPGTAAFDYPDSVQESEVTRRVQLLTDLARQGRLNYVKRHLGKEVEVLVEKSKEKSCIRGISDNYLKLLIQSEDGELPLPGTVLRCIIPQEQPDLTDKDYDAVCKTLSAKYESTS